jgi:hypothetical protein
MDKFSVQTITALIDVVTGGSSNDPRPRIGIYRSGPILEQFLGAAGLELHVGTNSRVSSVRGVLMRANETDEGRQSLQNLIEQVADPREYIKWPDKERAVFDYLNNRLLGDGYELTKVGERARLVKRPIVGAVASDLSGAALKLNFDSVQQELDRALAQVEGDPEDAVTAACSTLESVCKCLLDEMSEAYPTKQDLQGLIRAVTDKLDLSPGKSDVEPDIRRILGGLTNVAAGVGAIRMHSGDAHGRGKKLERVEPRIARLAIHAASTVAFFLSETWQKLNVKAGESRPR